MLIADDDALLRFIDEAVHSSAYWCSGPSRFNSVCAYLQGAAEEALPVEAFNRWIAAHPEAASNLVWWANVLLIARIHGSGNTLSRDDEWTALFELRRLVHEFVSLGSRPERLRVADAIRDQDLEAQNEPEDLVIAGLTFRSSASEDWRQAGDRFVVEAADGSQGRVLAVCRGYGAVDVSWTQIRVASNSNWGTWMGFYPNTPKELFAAMSGTLVAAWHQWIAEHTETSE